MQQGRLATTCARALMFLAPLQMGAVVAIAQEEEAPEPYIPYSEVPAEQSAMDRDLQSCEENLGYVGCEEMRHGKFGNARGRPLKPQIFGALAVSLSTLKYASAINEKTEDAARQSALARCQGTGATDCRVEKTMVDACMALAFSRPQRLYAVGGPTGAGNFADDAALLKCRRAGGKSCAVEISVCADGARHQLNGHTEFANGNPIFVPGQGPVPAPGNARNAAPGDDTANFYGSWTASFPVNGQTMTVLSIHDANGYRNFNVTPTVNVPIASGSFTAANGRYRTNAPSPNDTGTYRFADPDTAVCTNAAGQTLTWKRQGARPVDANATAKARTNSVPHAERPGTAPIKR